MGIVALKKLNQIKQKNPPQTNPKQNPKQTKQKQTNKHTHTHLLGISRI